MLREHGISENVCQVDSTGEGSPGPDAAEQGCSASERVCSVPRAGLGESVLSSSRYERLRSW